MEQLTGRLTADARVNEVKGGRKVINFSIAINDRYKPKDGEVKELTRFVNCSYWTNPGIAPYLTKGALVELNGRIDLNVWNNAEGKAKGVLTMHVTNIKLLDKAKTQEAQVKVTAVQPTEAVSKDLPF